MSKQKHLHGCAVQPRTVNPAPFCLWIFRHCSARPVLSCMRRRSAKEEPPLSADLATVEPTRAKAIRESWATAEDELEDAMSSRGTS